ncbi:MAG: hypothetical protein HYS61_00435 [Acidobacteria bacterium]|nr:hypothetical protein [Acidobacteriota bacterium]
MMRRFSRLFEDPTPNGLLNSRFLKGSLDISSRMELSQEEQEQVLVVLVLVARKLASMYQHKAKFQDVLASLVTRVEARRPPDPPFAEEIELSQDLFIEFDEFLVQLKSALDHVVKVLVPILGARRWTIRTFAKRGDGVIRALESASPSEYRERSFAIIEHLIRPNQEWIQMSIDARDRLNHFLDGGISWEYFGVCQTAEGVIQTPKWAADQTLDQLMEIVWANAFRFCEDFVAFSLAMRLPKAFALQRGPTALERGDPIYSVVFDEGPERALRAAIEKRRGGK